MAALEVVEESIGVKHFQYNQKFRLGYAWVE